MTALRLLCLSVLLVLAPRAPAATLYVDAASTNAVPPYTNWLTAAAVIQDAIDASADGDEVVVTNGVYASGGRAIEEFFLTNRVLVDRAVMLRSVNGPEVTIIQGYQVPESTNGDGAIRCVYLANGSKLSGFTLTNGATHFSPLWQLESVGGGVWCESVSALVSNCAFTGNSSYYYGGGAYGGTLSGCKLMGNSARYGGGACSSVVNNSILMGNLAYQGGGVYEATLDNCTLTENAAEEGGGGFSCTVYNCTLTGNAAGEGGGVFACTVYNCNLTGNSASGRGGGANTSTLTNCTLTGNSAELGGGAAQSMLNNCTITGNWASNVGGGSFWNTLMNCIVFFNTANADPNYFGGILSYCCTTPEPDGGIVITTEPLFVDLAGGDLRLQSNSPCINAGNNAYVTISTDLDGRPRIVGASVDMGAYEFQGEFTNWLAQFSLPTDGTADFTDGDHDGFNNYQEYRCGTDPTNNLSFLHLLPPVVFGQEVVLSWPSVTNRSYFLEWSTNLSATPAFLPLATNIPGQPGTSMAIHKNAAVLGPCFYRVAVP